MSGAESVWDVLGIAPTSDQRAIRLAYSAKLKAIDPEADPQAFIHLRDAFELARDGAARQPQAVPPPPAPSGPVWEDAAEPEPAPAEPEDPVATHANAIAELLYNHDPGADFLDPAAVEALLGHWNAIASDPQLEDVTIFDRVEQWSGAIILDTAPRSAPLIVPVADYFGWPARAGTLSETPGLARILQCYHAIRFVDAAQQPGHSHHAEWVELNTPAPEGAKRGTVGPRKLFELTNLIRWIRPDLAAKLDPARLALWDRKAEFEAGEVEPELGRYGTGAAAGGGIGLIWIGFLLVRACAGSHEETPPPPPEPSYYQAPAEPVAMPSPLYAPAPQPTIRLEPMPSVPPPPAPAPPPRDHKPDPKRQ